MEEKEGFKNGSGVTNKGDEAPQSFRIETRVQNAGGSGGVVNPLSEMKKRRGRPRKYSGDGPVTALSPMPISASIPLSGDYSAWPQSATAAAPVKPIDSFKKKHKLEFDSPGKMTGYSAGGGFTPHVITVNTGEDVTMRIISFSQQGSRAICILAANGSVSNVTLRQHDSGGGTLTYEGRFEILSLTGLFMPSDNGVTKSRSGGLSVSLAGPDGRVLGGGLAGMLIAACPVQVVIGSFVPGQQQEQQQQQQKPKKPKYESTFAFAPSVPSNPNNNIPEERYESAVVYSAPNPNLTNSASFHGDINSAPMNPMHGFKITVSENNHQLPGHDSRD